MLKNRIGHVCVSKTRACHIKTQKTFGPDRGNLWPGCDQAHMQQHGLGIPEFERKWDADLKAIALELDRMYPLTSFDAP